MLHAETPRERTPDAARTAARHSGVPEQVARLGRAREGEWEPPVVAMPAEALAGLLLEVPPSSPRPKSRGGLKS